VLVNGQAVFQRLTQNRLQGMQCRSFGLFAGARRVSDEKSGGGVQTEQRQGLVSGIPQLGAQDRWVRQSVAVHLAGQRVGYPA
jgi:hypothetical protein